MNVGTFAGTLVNMREVLVNMAMQVRQSSTIFAKLRVKVSATTPNTGIREQGTVTDGIPHSLVGSVPVTPVPGTSLKSFSHTKLEKAGVTRQIYFIQMGGVCHANW